MMRKPRMLGWSAATLIVLAGAVMAVAYLFAAVNFVRAQHERREGGLYEPGNQSAIVRPEPARETM